MEVWQRIPKILLEVSGTFIRKKESLYVNNNYWARTKICFGLLKSSLLCLRSLGTVCRKVAEFEVDVDVSDNIARI